MPNKKDSKPAPSPDKQVLEARVDALMDPKRPASAKAKASTPIDIFEDAPSARPPIPTTAPTVSGKLLSQTDITDDTQPAAKPKATDQPAEQTAETPLAANTPDDAPFSDAATDQAVDDIAATEGDAILAAEDAAAKPLPSKPVGWKAKLGRLLKNKWTWLGLAGLLIILMAVPLTRYKLLGLVIKKPVTFRVIDSQTATPVSNALVNVAGKTAKTDANGKAILKVPLGRDKVNVTKQYYKVYASSLFVGFKVPRPPLARLIATGRQVPITVLNKISGKPLANTEIKVLHTTAKTNARGQAIVVLPASVATDSATLNLDSYNTATVNVQVTSSVVSGNTFTLTPAGHLYFLSNLSGTIDVVKTNLDGSGRQTILAGTGKESPATTSLLASRDWRYLVFKAQRAAGPPTLSLIDTSADKVTTFDTSNAAFNLIGWYGHDFMYDLVSNTTPQSQTGHEIVKSYDADHSQLNQLDQDQAEGTAASYAYQAFDNFYVLNNELTYTTQWYTYAGYDISSKSDTIRAIQPDGQGKKDYQSFPTSGLASIQSVLYKPAAIYYAVSNDNTNMTTYYNFANQTVDTASTANQSTFAQTYPTYLVSPSGNQTLWAGQLNGSSALFVGDANAQDQKQISSSASLTPYGWYSDNYVLVSQNNSQLYIMPATGLPAGKQPLKVSDYYKPSQTYTASSYSYGGL